MSDIRFSCPSCGQSIEAPAELASQLIDCPNCKETIEVPLRTRPVHVAEPPTEPSRPVAIGRISHSPPPAEKFSVRHVIGTIGAIILFVGVFTPIVNVPIMGPMNYFQNGKGDGAVVLVLAVLSLLAIVTRKDAILFFTSIGCLGALTFTFVNFKVSMDRLLGQAGGTDDVFSGLAHLAVQSVQLQWGWAVLIVGACLTLAPLFVKSVPEDTSLRQFFKLAVGWRVAAGVISGLCAAAIIAVLVWPTWASPQPATASPVPSAEKPHWQLRSDISPIDDSKSYFLSKDAEEAIGTGFMRSTPTLMIRYKERELDVYITFGTYLGSDTVPVTLRLGQSPASQESWGLSTDGRAIFCPSDERAFVQELLKNDRLVIRLTPFGESPVTSTFDLTGLSEALQPMRALIQR